MVHPLDLPNPGYTDIPAAPDPSDLLWMIALDKANTHLVLLQDCMCPLDKLKGKCEQKILESEVSI